MYGAYLCLIVCVTWPIVLAGDRIIPLKSYCEQIDSSCSCDPQANVVRVYCQDEYAMLIEVIDTGINIAMSYYATRPVHWLPKFSLGQVAKFEFDAYNYWPETFLSDLLNALGVKQLSSVKFRDRSSEVPSSSEETDNFEELPLGSNTTSWAFNAVPALQYFRFESTQADIDENIFQPFDNLTTLELKLAVRELPKQLFANVSHSLRNLSIVNRYMLELEPELLRDMQELRSMSLQLTQPSKDKGSKLVRRLFRSMQQLEELRLTRATRHMDPKMLRGSYKLRLIKINSNPDLTELPSELFVDQSKLSTLDLSNNALSKLHSKLFHGLNQLQLLDLSSNRLASLSSAVHSLKYIDMRYTQFYGIKLNMPYEALVCTNDDSCQYKYNSSEWECDPQCICWVERSSKSLFIDCRGSRLTALPPLPRTTLVEIVLKFSNNSLKQLPNATDFVGLANVSVLNVAENQLAGVDASLLPDKMSMLDVRSNKITVFNQAFIDYMQQENNTMSMKLAGNPLSCNCEALPLLSFVRAQPQRVPDMGEIYCNSYPDRPFQQLEVFDLCPSYAILIGCIVGGLVIFVCLLSVVYLIYQQELRIWLYNHNLCLWWVSEEELDKDKTYDAFISYSHKDEPLVAELLPQLEHGLHAFRVCLHGRDWLVGDCIPEQIVRTVNESKRVIIVLSQHFIDSVWARMEFRIAYQATLQDKRKRIIIILYKELQHFHGIDSELRAYLKLNTYLKWGDPLFWSKLLYAMPHNRRVLKGQKKHAGPLI
ncbi:Tehao [Drosophila busckii]|uniref:Tehao n=1 Tax=Drosophila busckii TaxID=30019 RepID=A0A0M5IYY9_DROBS|nr:Tehao [Drosophila busckii]